MGYSTVPESSGNSLGDIADILGSVESLASLTAAGTVMVVYLIIGIVALLLAVAVYIFHSIPIYSMAKKLGLKNAWLAWVPICHNYFRLYLLSEMAGDKPFDPTIGNFKIANRRMSFLYYILINVLGGAVVGTVVTIASMILPIIGSLSAILCLLPAAACGIIEYVYLRDVLDLYNEDAKKNNTTAIVITVVEALSGLDIIKTGYLYTLLKKEPLSGTVIAPVEEIDVTPAQ